MSWRGAARTPSESDLVGELLERGGDPQRRGRVDSKFVVAATQVLDEGVPADDNPYAPVGPQPAHRSQPGLEPAVVALDAVVGVLLGVVERVREQLVDDVRERRRPVGCDLLGPPMDRVIDRKNRRAALRSRRADT